MVFLESDLKIVIKSYLKNFNNGKIDHIKENDIYLLYPNLAWTSAEDIKNSSVEEWHFSNTKNKRWFNEKEFLRYLKKINIEFDNAEAVIKNLNNLILDRFRSGFDEANKEKSFLNFLKEEHEFRSINRYFHLIDLVNIENNVFTFKDEVRFKTEENKDYRFDLVLFVNGFPLVVIELKKENTFSGIPQVQNYINKCGSFFTPNLFSCVISINSFYIGWKESFTRKKTLNKWVTEFEYNALNKSLLNKDIIRSFVTEVLAPERVLSFLNVFNYICYSLNEDKSQNKERRICYAHQFQAAFKVLKQYNENKKLGIIWHPTGSGKTTTMYYVSQLLSNWVHKDLTFFVVTDRIELLEQANEYFRNSIGEKSVYLINSRKDLQNKFLKKIDANVNSYAGSLFIFNLQKISEELLLLKDEIIKKNTENYIFLIDEAHRSYNDNVKKEKFKILDKDKNDPFSYSKILFDIFEKSKFLGFTATVISTKSVDTVKKFGGITHRLNIKAAIDANFITPFTFLNTPIVSKKDLVNKKAIETGKIQPIVDEKINDLKEKKDIVLTNIENEKLLKPHLYEKQYEDESFINKAVNEICNDYKKKWDTKIWGKSLVVCKSIKAAIRVYKKLLEQAKKANVLQKEYKYYKELLNFKKEKKEKLISYEEFCDKSIKIIFSKECDSSDSNSDSVESLKITDNDIKDIRQDFKKVLENDKDIKIVVVVNMLLVGYDCPPLENVYVLRNLSPVNAVQMIGRVDRRFTFNILKNNFEKESVEKEYGRILNFTSEKFLDLINKYYQDNGEKELEYDLLVDDNLIIEYIKVIAKNYVNILKNFIGESFWNLFYGQFFKIFNLLNKNKKKSVEDAENLISAKPEIYQEFKSKVIKKVPVEFQLQKKIFNNLDYYKHIKYKKVFDTIPNLSDILNNFFNKFNFTFKENTFDNFYLEYRMFFNENIKKIDSYCRHLKKNVFQQIRQKYFNTYKDLHIFYWIDKIIKTEDAKILSKILKNEIEHFINKKKEVPFFVDQTKSVTWSGDLNFNNIKSESKNNELEVAFKPSAFYDRIEKIKKIKEHSLDSEEHNEIEMFFTKTFARYGFASHDLSSMNDDIKIYGYKNSKELDGIFKKIDKIYEKVVPSKEKYYFVLENEDPSENINYKIRHYCYSNEVLNNFTFNLERAIKNYFDEEIFNKTDILKDKNKFVEFSKKFLINFFASHPAPKKGEDIELTFSSKKSIKNYFLRFTKEYYNVSFNKNCFHDIHDKDAFLENINGIFSNLLIN